MQEKEDHLCKSTLDTLRHNKYINQKDNEYNLYRYNFKDTLNKLRHDKNSNLDPESFQVYKQWNILKKPLFYGISAIVTFFSIKYIQRKISYGLDFHPPLEFLRPITAYMNTNKDIINNLCKKILYVVFPIGNTITFFSISSNQEREEAIRKYRYHYLIYDGQDSYYENLKDKFLQKYKLNIENITDNRIDHTFWFNINFIKNLGKNLFFAALFSSFKNTDQYLNYKKLYDWITDNIFRDTQIPEDLKIKNNKEFLELKKEFSMINKDNMRENLKKTTLKNIQKILIYQNSHMYDSEKLKFSFLSMIKLGAIFSLIYCCYYTSSLIKQIKSHGIKYLNFMNFLRKYAFFDTPYRYLIVNPDYFILFSRFFQQLCTPLIITVILKSIFSHYYQTNFIYNTNNHMIINHNNFNSLDNNIEAIQSKLIPNLNNITNNKSYKCFFDFIQKPYNYNNTIK